MNLLWLFEGSNSKINGSSGGLFERAGLMTISSFRVGAYSRRGFSRGGGLFEDLRYLISVSFYFGIVWEKMQSYKGTSDSLVDKKNVIPSYDDFLKKTRKTAKAGYEIHQL